MRMWMTVTLPALKELKVKKKKRERERSRKVMARGIIH
jgi:hypothetical protein